MASLFSHLWWTDPLDLRAYTYSDPNVEYDKEYFESEHHPSEEVAKQLYDYMQQTYKQVFGRYFKSVLEFGAGSGEITAQFHEDDLHYFVVEPTTAGYEKLLSKGIYEASIIPEDIRFMYDMNYKFDLVVCTEVAEHIEPWFASKVVEACTTHSDRVWFSAASEFQNPHYHHPNVAPIHAWDKIFALFGYDYIVLENKFDRAERLYHR
jgi:hypothetical protein